MGFVEYGYGYNPEGTLDCHAFFEMFSQTWAPSCPDCIWAFEGVYEVVIQSDECGLEDVEFSQGIAYYGGYGYVFLIGTRDGSHTDWYFRGPAEWDGREFYYGFNYSREELNDGQTWYYNQLIRYYGQVMED